MDRMEPAKHEVETESVPESRQTAVDRLTTLPPELIGLIYDAIYPLTPKFVQFPHQFEPIHSRLLHFQRVNLYRQVVLYDERRLRLSQFAIAIQRNQKLGELVEKLSIGCKMTDSDEIMEEYGNQTLREMVTSITLHLTKLSSLFLQSTSLVNFFYQSSSHYPLLAQLTDLTLFTGSTKYFATILPLSPRLSRLYIDASAAPVSTRLIRLSTPSRAPMTSLILIGDFSNPQIKNLIASSDPASLKLFGFAFEKGLKAVQDSEVVNRLTLETEEEEGGVESELIAIQLARFTHLTHLTLTGKLGLMPWLKELFCDCMTQLETIDLNSGSKVDTDLLLECLPFFSKRLKALRLDNIPCPPGSRDPPNWTNECSPKGVAKVIEHFRAQGIKVYGMTVDALAFVEPEDLTSETV